MGKIFCTECGTEIDDSASFCSKCGAKVDDDDSKKSMSSNTNVVAKNLINTISKEPKIIILIAVVILLIVGVFALMSGGTNDSTGGMSGSSDGNFMSNSIDYDLVYVTDVIFEINAPYGGTNVNYDDYLSVVVFKIIPKETISGVTSVKATNVKITYGNGVTDDIGTITFKNKNTYLQGTEYTFFYKYNVKDNVYKQNVHVSGDIVVDTLDEQNKVIGRLDYDTTAKAWSANYV